MPGQMTEQIIGAAMEAHRVLEPGLMEQFYKEPVCQTGAKKHSL